MTSTSTSILDAVSPHLPAHVRALQLQQYAAQVGFDWPEVQQVFIKLKEEIKELQDEIMPNADPQKLLDEFGDILFVCINLARHLRINPEQALQHANDKFARRFCDMEQFAKQQQIDLQQQDLATLEQLWKRAKESEK